MNYTELDVWVNSRQLVTAVYQSTKSFPKDELYGLTNQIRRSAVSVPSNIAEGIGRQTTKDTIHFLYISRGSLYELETQLLIASDLEYLNKNEKEILLEKISVCKKLLNGFINYYKNKING
ncbi:MAG: four helix bundle protein [Flavobacteriaceae bacterium]|nr:four helix bundle protein [Flavobacteriaceae bacterium]